MSASASFEFRSAVGEEKIRDCLRSLWDGVLGDGYSAELLCWSPVGYQVHLYWFFGQPKEDVQARQVIDYLLSIAVDGRLHYLRDSDAFVRGSDPDYPTAISIDDILHGAFRPGLHNGVQYRYLIQSHEERASQPSNRTSKASNRSRGSAVHRG